MGRNGLFLSGKQLLGICMAVAAFLVPVATVCQQRTTAQLYISKFHLKQAKCPLVISTAQLLQPRSNQSLMLRSYYMLF